MPRSPPSSSFRYARTPAPRPSSPRKASRSGPEGGTRRRSRRGCTRPTPRRTCATRRPWRSTCTGKSTRAPTCRPRSTSRRWTATHYKFLFIAKGGGSANKTALYQETKALLTPESIVKFLVGKFKTLGTAACPPYHIAVVVGGTSADACLKAVKLASARYLRRASHPGQRARPGVPRPGTGEETARGGLQARHRRPVRRKVLRPRRPGHPPPAPRRLVPGRDGRVVLGRPQRQGEDHAGRRLRRGAGPQSGPPHSGGTPGQAGERRAHRPEPADEGDPGRAVEASGVDAAPAQWRHRRRARHRAREVQGAHRRRQARAGLPARSTRSTTPARPRLRKERPRLLRPDDRRPHGFLRGPAAGQGRPAWS